MNSEDKVLLDSKLAELQVGSSLGKKRKKTINLFAATNSERERESAHCSGNNI